MDAHDLRCHDAQQKTAMKMHDDHVAHAAPLSISVGKYVLLKPTASHSKMISPFEPQPYTVLVGNGSMFTVKRGEGQVIRHSSFLKRVDTAVTHQIQRNNVNCNSPCFKPADDVVVVIYSFYW